MDDDSDDESQKQNAQDEDDDEDNASLEPVIDNDNGEEEHLQRLAEQNKGPVADDAATEQEPESSTASRESLYTPLCLYTSAHEQRFESHGFEGAVEAPGP